ncbi:MAG TPA: hypothetical protein VGF67_01550 [Ktedonobacteraceae bacterium]|jgi:hypothetical protein
MFNQPYPPDSQQPVRPSDANTVPNMTQYPQYPVNERDAPIENRANPPVPRVENRVETFEDKNLRRAVLRNWITGIIYFLLGVLEVILGLRFIFRLLGANEGSDFIMFLYNLSHAFVGPFNNIFNDQSIGSRSVFELSTLISMLIYALIGWGLASLTRVLLSPSYGSQQTVSTWRQQR